MWDELEKKYDKLGVKENILTLGESVKNTLSLESSRVEEAASKLRECSNIILTGAGDKYIIPCISKIIWRYYSKKPIEVYHSRCLVEQDLMLDNDSAVIFLSQSGATYDTIQAFKKLNYKIKLAVWITNLKHTAPGSIYDLKTENCIILNTHTIKYPEKPLISTSTFQTTLALLNDLLLTTINTPEALDLKKTQREKLPALIEETAKNPKIIEWAKRKALELVKHRGETFYVVGDGIRYLIAVKQAVIMFMEGCKQDACHMRAEEFIHSLIETLEPENPVKKPLILLNPHRSFASESLMKTARYITKMWRKYAGEDKIILTSPYDFIKNRLGGLAGNLLSPALYAIPLMWLTYYYALTLGVDPGISRLVSKIRRRSHI
ncbi:MAG: SIS domain-containing protein [Candidatus Odinarchaeum yellowstonii]|uniref:SIS domain-containing protein n=1 Tax=Odinarchaeota yellowstonii (strain LCB_4) TaxID=1841599 RepID=A0AAF0D177_ODILC|nr:MAG: SIS domain-containing protein [Candidatus Odinarchaeum yellowstonii]